MSALRWPAMAVAAAGAAEQTRAAPCVAAHIPCVLGVNTPRHLATVRRRGNCACLVFPVHGVTLDVESTTNSCRIIH
jgi:2-keto-3-deoxy-6-phosphogluconate aldolase